PARGLVESRGNDLPIYRALHVGDFLRSLVDQEDDQEYLGVVVGDRLGDVLEEHGLTRARRRHDQRALALPLRADQVDYPRRLVLHRRIGGVEIQPLIRVERSQVVEIGAVADRIGVVIVDARELGQREIAFAVLRRADLAFDRVTGAQSPFADLVWRNVDVVGTGQIVRFRAAQEAET